MNCISIAIFPPSLPANITRVIEYFYPGEGRSKIWVDIFLHNPTDTPLSIKVLHAGSLTAANVSEDSWLSTDTDRDKRDRCAGVLSKRIVELHKRYFPISIDFSAKTVWLNRDEYRVWTGSIHPIVGSNPTQNDPFTLWELAPVSYRRTVLRLRLEMHKPTYDQRFSATDSFFAHGEGIVLSGVEGALRSYKGADADTFNEHFRQFKEGHRVPENFEYLIVSPDETELPWYAETLSAEISPRIVGSDLAKTTRWFVTDRPFADDWTFVLDVKKRVLEPV